MKTLIACLMGGVIVTGCVHRDVEYRDERGREIVEPSGAAVMEEDWRDQPRDINQRPYGWQFQRQNRTVSPDAVTPY